MKVLFLESRRHYERANIIDVDRHFPDSDVSYFGQRFYNKESDFFEKFDLIISTVYTSPINNYIILKCRLLNIDTLLLSDGIIEWENMYNNPFVIRNGIKLYNPIHHKFFATSGEIEKNFFESISDSKCINFTPERMKSPELSLNRTIMKEYVLLTTANKAYFNSTEKTLLVDILLALQRELLEVSQKYKVRIFDKELLSKLKEKDESLFNDIDSSFCECISNVNSVFTTPSSIALTAMELKVPVCQIIYRNTPIFVQSGWMLTNKYLIRKTVGDILDPDPERMSFQTSMVNNHSSSESISDQIKNNNFERKELKLIRLEECNFTYSYEPYIRWIDDVIKLYSPRKIVSFWRKIVRKFY